MGKALLIITVGFATIFTGMFFNITSTQQLSANKLVDTYEKWDAENTAESIRNVALSLAYQNVFGAGDKDTFDVWGTKVFSETKKIAVDSVHETEQFLITVKAVFEEDTLFSYVNYMHPAYSSYYYIIHGNNWPSHITYTSSDTIKGMLHTNTATGVKISGYPIFYKKISMTVSDFSPSSAAPKIYGGVDFEATAIPVPGVLTNLAPLWAVAASGSSHKIVATSDDKVYITFNDTTYTIKIGSSATTGPFNISAYNGIIYVSDNGGVWNSRAFVKGTLDGKITICCDDDIYIDGDLVYKKNPLVYADSDDYLGLVTRDDIFVANNGISNIDIHAAILAKDNFEVEDWFISLPRGNLTIVGALCVDNEDRVGNGLLSGFSKKIHKCDERLLTNTPPYFPRLTRKEVIDRRIE